jgi:nitrite reductase/ring-hydroxylating ferredoxin subunit/uncharacterized membrane protein
MLQAFIEAVQDQVALDRVADPIQPVLKQAFRETDGPGATLKNFLSGTWIGHPLHPILKDLPIGAWTMAALFDGLCSRGGDTSLERAADISIATGLVGALASAVTGLADWTDTRGHARRIGVAHALLNVTATGFYAASLIARRRNRTTGMRAAYAGYAIMLLGAYLGGHLVFSEQIGVNHAVEPSLPTDFVRVMPASELTNNEPRKADMNGIPLVLVRQNERIFALLARCAHMAGPLDEGNLEGSTIRCPWHGSRYELSDGRVVEGPATVPQPCFEARIKDDWIEVRARHQEAP